MKRTVVIATSGRLPMYAILLCAFVGVLCLGLIGCGGGAGNGGMWAIGSLRESPHWVPVRVDDPGPGPSPESYSDLQFVNAERGWMLRTPRGELIDDVLHTVDGGRTWVAQPA